MATWGRAAKRGGSLPEEASWAGFLHRERSLCGPRTRRPLVWGEPALGILLAVSVVLCPVGRCEDPPRSLLEKRVSEEKGTWGGHPERWQVGLPDTSSASFLSKLSNGEMKRITMMFKEET